MQVGFNPARFRAATLRRMRHVVSRAGASQIHAARHFAEAARRKNVGQKSPRRLSRAYEVAKADTQIGAWLTKILSVASLDK
jgi:hypothetical protein